MLSHNWTEILDPPMYYDRAGNVICMLQWTWRFSDPTYRFIARDVACEGVRVSTVWLGLDHAMFFGPPLIFETMVFLEGSWADVEMYRWPSEAQAIAGHDQLVANLRSQVAVEVVTQPVTPVTRNVTRQDMTAQDTPPPDTTN